VRARVERVGVGLLTDARSPHVYLVAALLGLATYVIVFGAGHLFGTNAYWQLPQADERMALMGYRYFLHAPWHWPVFVSDAVDVPYPKSVAFLDCIPIWALVNKAIATIVPPWGPFSEHAYLGLWHGLAYALQPCFGVAILRALGHRSWRGAFVTSAFFIALPTWIFRYGHPALSAHWVELWALYLYVRTPTAAPTPRKICVAKLCQLVVAAMVSPYPAVMSLLLFAASLLRTHDRRTIGTWLPLGVAAAGSATWFAGYLAHEAARAQWGFEFESANLLSWLVPQHSGIVGNAQWLANVNGTPWQYEGYAYLGLGVLVLLALVVPRASSLRAVVRRHRWLFGLVVLCCAFSLSNHIYWGSHQVASFPIPHLLRWVPSQFRSPGRFVWIPTYVLLAFLLHWALARFSTWRQFALLVLLALVQIVDATGDWAFERGWTASASAHLALSPWRALVAAHDEIWVIPTSSCLPLEQRGILQAVSLDLQWLASERALAINGTYSARANRRCAAEQADWSTFALRPGTLYVLLPSATALADRFQAEGASCGVFGFGRVCSAAHIAIAAAIQAGALHSPPAATALAYGEKLELQAPRRARNGLRPMAMVAGPTVRSRAWW
jgi:hypothetical protein